MSQPARLKTRLSRLRREMARLGLPALLITGRANITYVTGFTGTAGAVLLTSTRLVLVVDFRYFEQAAMQAPSAELVHVLNAHYDDALIDTIKELGVQRLAFEADFLEVSRHMALSWRLPGLELVPTRGLVEHGREAKDQSEISAIRKAAEITSQAISLTLALARPGMTERALAASLEAEMWRLGADGTAFPTLVAAGPRSALPHPSPTAERIAEGDFLLIDAGARVQGYCADMTRTSIIGRPNALQMAARHAVEAALAAGIAAVKPGQRAAAVDLACRKVLRERGYGEAFGHDTGHGVGLDIHESPRIAADAEDLLVPGMVITIEPGVYQPGLGGVRLEQLVLVTVEGAEVLTTAPLALSAPCTSVPGSL